MSTLNQNSRLMMPEWVIICTARYALGRMTYIVSCACDLLRETWPLLSEETKNILKRDIEAEFERAARMGRSPGIGHPLGMKCDVEEWEKVRLLWQSEEVTIR